MIKKQQGFTLIELLVVIAIIGILAGILVVAIDPKGQTDKATAAKTKAALNSIRTQSAVYFSEHSNSYTGLGGDTQVGNLVSSVTNGAVGVNSAGSAWAAEASYTNASGSTEYMCMDSTGNTTTGSASTITSGANSGDVICN